MTTASTTPGRVTFAGAVLSEWIKLHTLRSTMWLYAVLLAVSLGVAALMGATLTTGDGAFTPASEATLSAMPAVFGVFFLELVVAVLGVLAISGEYATGMIRSSLTAVPRRTPVLLAKALVLFVVTFVVGIVSEIGAFFVSQPLMATRDIEASITDSRVFLPLLGGALYLGLVAVFAMGVGAVLRNSAAAISATLGILMLLPNVLSMIPATWAQETIPSYLISTAGIDMLGVSSVTGPLHEPWQDFLIVVAWVVVWGAAGAALLKRRDA